MYLLGSRYCETDRLLERSVAPVRPYAARLVARGGDLRLRASAHQVWIPVRAAHEVGMGGVQRRRRRVPRLRSPCADVLPLHEHSRAILHRLPARHRRVPRYQTRWTSRDGSRRSSEAVGIRSTRATSFRASGASSSRAAVTRPMSRLPPRSARTSSRDSSFTPRKFHRPDWAGEECASPEAAWSRVNSARPASTGSAFRLVVRQGLEAGRSRKAALGRSESAGPSEFASHRFCHRRPTSAARAGTSTSAIAGDGETNETTRARR